MTYFIPILDEVEKQITKNVIGLQTKSLNEIKEILKYIDDKKRTGSRKRFKKSAKEVDEYLERLRNEII